MNYPIQKVKNYPISSLIIGVIWVLCLMPMPETPLDDVAFIDKWTHIAMYGGLCFFIWVEYFRQHKAANMRRLLTGSWLLPIVQGGLLELLQAYCTGGRRSGDWLDFAANASGATLMLCVGILWVWFRARR